MSEHTTTIRLLASVGPEPADDVRALLARTLPVDLRDDRFDDWPSGPGAESFPMTAAVATVSTVDGDATVAFLGGPIVEGRAELHVLVDPGVDDPARLAADMVRRLTDPLTAAGATSVQWWGRPIADWHDELAEHLGGERTRHLHQMRCPLPVDIAPIESRPYRPHDDLDALRTVNNRAFADHPSQGRETDESLLATMAQPWFDPDGLRIHEVDGRVAGFCWTKIHRSRTFPDAPDEPTTPLGEIFVIGVDPDFHGQGKGAPMTAAGLTWLVEQGLTTGMLYVEADNAPAVRTYERLGFEIVRSDAAWTSPIAPS
ncbi:MAG: GNAT family N-acetyltransferase [Actinomycetota bacterium]